MSLTDEQKAKALEAFRTHYPAMKTLSDEEILRMGLAEGWLSSWEQAIEYATQAAYERAEQECNELAEAAKTVGKHKEHVFAYLNAAASMRALAKESQASGKGEKG